MLALRSPARRLCSSLASCRGVVADPPGPPEACTTTDVPLAQLREAEVLVRVHAAGVNRPDCLQRAGGYPAPPGAPKTLGLEVAGQVVAASSGAAMVPGDLVVALVPGGGYAEYAVAPAATTLPLPYALNDAAPGSADDPFVRGAALPETLFTVWKNLFSSAPGSNSIAVQAGETLLVHGGSSGIGTTAIQLAVARGVRVLATAGSAAKCQACLDLGAEAAFDYREQGDKSAPAWVQGVKGIGPVSAVLDMVGGPYLQHNVENLNFVLDNLDF